MAPTDVLKAWLEANGTRVVRVPVTVVFGGRGVPGEARVTKIGELEVRVDDSPLGVSFDDRLRMNCKGVRPCRVWVEGKYADGTLKVLHFARAIPDDEAADVVEREE